MSKVEEIKETGVATLNAIELTKEGVPDMLKLVKEQISSINKGLPKSNKTTKKPDGFPLSVKDCKSIDELIKMHSFISAKEAAYNTSVKELGLTVANYPCKISGHTPEVWIKDIKFRLNIVKNKTKLDKLIKVRDILEANMSEEAKFAKQMGDMVGILSDLKVD